MDQLNFHKQKLYALIIAGVALVALLLPWLNVFGLQTVNGLRGWGILSLFGVIVVGIVTMLENRSSEYSTEYRKYAMIAFGAVALGALLFFLRKNSVVGGGIFNDSIKTGIGLWICLAAGIAGIALLYGLIKIENKNVSSNTNP
ncbi:MAG: hypothetical protein ACXWV9_00180 [Flavisolibacter sp.]